VKSVKSAVEPAIVKSVKSAVEPAAMKAAKSAPVKPAAVETSAPAVEASSPAMHLSVGEIWLAERGSAQQSSCGCQSPSYPGPGSTSA
jgi:hypothetical protein